MHNLWMLLTADMTGYEKLVFIGQLASGLSIIMALFSWWLWTVLPNEKKVLAVATLIFYCGALAMFADYFN